MMREAAKKSIEKPSDFRHRYIMNSFIEKYYKFVTHPSEQDNYIFLNIY